MAKGLSNYLDVLCDNVMQKTFRKIFPINVSFLAPYPDFFASSLVFLLSSEYTFERAEFVELGTFNTEYFQPFVTI